MKQKVGPAGIVVGICALAIVMFVLYRVFLPPPTSLPPGEVFKRPAAPTGPPTGSAGGPPGSNPMNPPASNPHP